MLTCTDCKYQWIKMLIQAWSFIKHMYTVIFPFIFTFYSLYISHKTLLISHLLIHLKSYWLSDFYRLCMHMCYTLYWVLHTGRNKYIIGWSLEPDSLHYSLNCMSKTLTSVHIYNVVYTRAILSYFCELKIAVHIIHSSYYS